ncbi:hypothetical protein OB69_13970 [Roseivirga seohaensis subsp. aquiponti]|uniref:Uncharacterized protein n=1 Tax=Roseivirga seohaensis subsp. aquiponti TaxID=1566026 RepID=A0A0L8AIS2_9BACT|nr:hypothetical protein [Roseivirga seohaensis]KOF02127.1 hypothetical protein OB69_13970 [Roseivirga seohaensis subsp. aquiponti]
MSLFSKSSTVNGNTQEGFKLFSESKHIGLLYSWEDSHKEKSIQEFANSLGSNKSIDFLCFNPIKKIQPATESPTFSRADFNLFGKIQSETVLSFMEKPFDYLFHLDFDINSSIKPLLTKSRANWKVGCHSDQGEGIYDLMIKINKSAGLKNLSDQMLIYVNALK